MEGIVLFSWLLFFQFAFSVSNNTLAMNQTFKDGDLLISEGKTFALGFFSPRSSSYRYLGIWFHKVSLQTVVWVANRDNPITGSLGFLSINRQLGNLVLYENKSNSPVWSTNVSTEAADTWEAKLLDSGNLILLGRNNLILWQSFEHPTNTILLGMKIGLNRKTGLNTFLTSWRSSSDPGTGNYSYSLNMVGSPQYFLNNGTERYWRSMQWPYPWKASEGYHCEFVNGDEIYHNCSFYDPSIISMLVLGESGFIRRLTWQESEGRWKQFSSFPIDHCDFYGRCGAYGKCDSNTVNRFECSCLPGYEPKSLEHWRISHWKDGCVRKRKASSSICGNGEGFMKVESVKLPDASVAAWVDTSMNHMDCEQECKSNCSCLAYSIVGFTPGLRTKCLAWYGELLDTRTLMASLGDDLYVRVDALELGQGVRKSSSFLGMKGKSSILIIFIPSTWLVILIIIYFWLKRWKRARKSKRRRRRIVDSTNISAAGNELEEGSSSHQDLTFFDFSTILAATGNFSSANKIGQGGFGTVYKGKLSSGQEIAVKRMSKSSTQGTEEFKNEVKLIAKLQHKNLVKLLGCCIKRKEKILIYEYLPNKSLDSFLFDVKRRSMMDWEKRFDIVAGIARGILYLHQDSRLTIIHRDLKSSNILLDAKMNPKISDFGMARIFHGDQIEGRTKRVVGTYGYMSPEYGLLGKFSVKSDVFSFGVIVLEVVTGKKSSSFHQEDPSLSLIGQVWELWSEGRALEIVDSSFNGNYNPDQAMRCIQVGILCVQEDAIDRPTMSEVILMLKSEKALPYPKQPAFIFKTSSINITKPPGGEEGTFSMNEITISDVSTR